MKKIARKKEQSKAASRLIKGSTPMACVVRWRFITVCGFCVMLAGALVWRIAEIQVLPSTKQGYQFLQTQGQARSIRTETIPAHRGVITDRNGEPLAVSTPVLSLCANPQVLIEAKEHWQSLAKQLNLPVEQLAETLTRYATKEFLYLERHMAPADAEKILSLNIPGVFARQEYRRFYPAAEVAAHVIGVTNIDDAGQEGMELAYEEWLRGSPGAKQVLKDLKGRVIEDLQLIKSAEAGRDLALSIDLRLQYLAYRELKAAITKHRAVSGSAVVLDSRSGEILAMVNSPSYNPNNRRTVAASAMKNRAVTDLFEPGSTMKPLTIMAAMETGKYTPRTIIDTTPGYIRVSGGKVFRDFSNYGVIDVTKIITKSSQVGTTKIALDLEPEAIRGMFYRMGLGQSTGSGFPGEAVGRLPAYRRWSEVQRANYAFGYGLSVTTLQLAQAYNVMANRGVKKPVSLLRLNEEALQKQFSEQVVDKRIAEQMLDMLETVIEPGGTATRAKLDAYSAGGKTGTARIAGAGGYTEDVNFAVFAGIAPITNPRIVVAVMVNEPRQGEYGGGEVAAPIFGAIAEGSLRILQVPPDKSPARVAVKGGQPNSGSNEGPLS